MRIRNFFARISGVFEGIVRDCCHDRARLGGSRRRAFSRSRLRGPTRVDPRSRQRQMLFDNWKCVQRGATRCNRVQPGATWCNRMRECAKRTQFARTEESPLLRCANPRSGVRGFFAPEGRSMSRNAPKCPTNTRMRRTTQFRFCVCYCLRSRGLRSG